MVNEPVYSPRYDNSHALVIGINRYKEAPPLANARNDAEAIAQVLHNRFKFLTENIAVLLDQDATRATISTAFLRLASENVTGPNDRVLVFFAGHGHTVTGYSREVGYLVPVDGRVEDLATLIRWDELTRNADLIPAKHIFFLMDACYGGLALTRKPSQAGRMRFMKDMLQRRSRQVLTAGKGDEVVSDSGGTRIGHSIFTSHVLDAMYGNASFAPEVLSASTMMSYVYQQVGNDSDSHQTPHFGSFEGDGDFIFDLSLLASIESDSKEDNDILAPIGPIQSPLPTQGIQSEILSEPTLADTFKRLIGNPQDRIQVDGLVNRQLRKAIDSLSVKAFPVQRPEAPTFTPDVLTARLTNYEAASADVQRIAMILAKWAEPNQLAMLERISSRLGEIDKGSAGLMAWINFGWYPMLLITYSAGISALSSNRYDSIVSWLYAPVVSNLNSSRDKMIIPMVSAMTDALELFKLIPGYERNYTPRSDHLFKVLQPILEDELLLGREYEVLFDKFEILLALVFADQRGTGLTGHVWGPPGRFAWKHRNSRGGLDSPYVAFVADAAQHGTNWGALKAGFFDGSIDRFKEISSGYIQLLNNLGWF